MLVGDAVVGAMGGNGQDLGWRLGRPSEYDDAGAAVLLYPGRRGGVGGGLKNRHCGDCEIGQRCGARF